MLSRYGPPSESFKKFDADGDGQISAEEWEKACEALGIPKDRAADLLKEVDQDGDGQVRVQVVQGCFPCTLHEGV